MDRNGRREVRNLIVNADDLGWTHGVNRGIAEAHRNGIVTSASLLANGRAFEAGVQMAGESPRLGVGVHLNLSDGKPVAPAEEVKSLLDENGDFSGGPEALLFRLTAKSLETKEVETEWNAQIEKVRAAGVCPNHLDRHKPDPKLPGPFCVSVRRGQEHRIR